MTTGSTHSIVQLYRQLIEISMNTYNIQCQRNGFPLHPSTLVQPWSLAPQPLLTGMLIDGRTGMGVMGPDDQLQGRADGQGHSGETRCSWGCTRILLLRHLSDEKQHYTHTMEPTAQTMTEGGGVALR
jgi:hypothetical protein